MESTQHEVKGPEMLLEDPVRKVLLGMAVHKWAV